jgi:hypothetical protein
VSLEDGAKFKGSIEMDPQAVQGVIGRAAAPKAAPAPAAAKPAAPQPASPVVPPVAKQGVIS